MSRDRILRLVVKKIRWGWGGVVYFNMVLIVKMIMDNLFVSYFWEERYDILLRVEWWSRLIFEYFSY